MRLKSRHSFPPNGWQFYQPETGWSPTPYMGFSETVLEIQKHRQANPRFNLAAEIPAIENELESYTVSRLASMAGGSEYLLDDGGSAPPVFPSRRPLRERVADAAGSARRIVIGIQTMTDWLGTGLVPVDHAEADRRSSLCVRCPNNLPGSPLVDAAAETMRRLVAAKNDMKLVTSHDEKLETCSACSCRLTLKVWAPLPHILKHTDDDIRSDLWSECWILEGSQPPNSPP